MEYDFVTSNLVVTIVECHVSQRGGKGRGIGRGRGRKGEKGKGGRGGEGEGGKGERGENEGKGEGLKKGPIVLTASVLAHEIGLKQGNKYIAVLIITCTFRTLYTV